MSQNRSDYTSPTNWSFASKLPDVHRNPLIDAMSSSLFDRFVTKQETQRIIGSIGRRNSTAVKDDRVVEESTFKQAFQLQPIIQAIVGSETLYYTYEDILRMCERNGIDTSKVQDWQSTNLFNFALPIDLDKYINYANYLWVDETILPQYVTIKNNQLQLQQRLAQRVKHYLDLLESNDASRADLWSNIERGLNLVTTHVAIVDYIKIEGIDEVIADSIHAPYVYTPVYSQKYEIKNQWQRENKWVHKLHVVDATRAKRATMPILEYSEKLQLTGWTYTKHAWKYRRSASQAWQDTTAEPTDNELFNRFSMTALDATVDAFVISGDKRALFPVGKKFAIEGSTIYNGVWTVKAVDFSTATTTIWVEENVIAGTASGRLVPTTVTSQGDSWENFFDQWMYVRAEASVPTTPPETQYVPEVYSTYATTGQVFFNLPFTYFPGADVLCVYVNGRRQYGNYDEFGHNAFQFVTPRVGGEHIEVRTAASTYSDFNRMSVQVRVDEAGTTDMRCLIQYRPAEQVKNNRNDYPLFDLVDDGGVAKNKSSSLIKFAESSDADININFGKRIVVDALTKDYEMYIEVADGSLGYFIYDGDVTTVWQPVDAEYVPIKVDSNGAPAANGAFEIPRQLTNNVHHELHSTMRFSELFAHFRSIVSAQPTIDAQFGSLDTISAYHLMDNVSYGVGGSIQEHNYSFDTFVSTLISSDSPYSSVVEFARDQYRELLVDYRTHVEDVIVDALKDAKSASIVDLTSFVATQSITSIENDSSLYKLYGDSTVGQKYGSVKNWIATLPYFGFVEAVKPLVLKDTKRGILTLVHHDGHISNDELGTSTVSLLMSRIVKELNPSTTSKPTVPDASVTPGQLYYDATAEKLYRLDVVAVGRYEPLTSAYPDGSFWVRTDTNQLYVRSNGNWIVHASTLNDAWSVVDIASLLINSVLTLETKLYEGSKNIPIKYDLVEEPFGVNDDTRQAAFEAWCKRNNIAQPYQGNYKPTDAFTWYYGDINDDLWHDVRTGTFHLAPSASLLYYHNYGTVVPNLEPWVLQGYVNKPDWWDAEYKGTARPWSRQMWANIKAGVVPIGRALPNGVISVGSPVLPLYSRVSVNTTDLTTADGFGPDDLLPPYWVPSAPADNATGIADEVLLDCEYDDLTNVAKNWFEYGDLGPNEEAWTDSIDFLYDHLVVQYTDQPVRVVATTLGEKGWDVNGLHILQRTNRVRNHRDIQFHGDVDENNDVILIDGVNQWYTQFFRYNNLDTNATNYKDVWKNWDTKLSYNVGNFLVDNTLSLSSGQIELAPDDYTVDMKVNRRVTDSWIDALYIDIDQAGSRRELPQGYGRDTKFLVSIRAPISREVSYYPVRKFRATTSGDAFILSDYTLANLNWNEAQVITVQTGLNGVLPAGLEELNYYYIIPTGANTFKVALSVEEAQAGKFVSFDTNGSGALYVGELDKVFYALERQQTQSVWRHYVVDKNRTTSFTDSISITGIQNLIDFIDGYAAYLSDRGYVFNDSSALEYDATTNRQVNWQFEIERVINQLYLVANAPNLKTSLKQAVGTLDVNPFRNHLWITHDSGVVSSFDATDTKQTQYRAIVYNSFGNLVHTKYFHVLREDKLTHLANVTPQTFVDGIASNDFATTQYSLTNIGGAHIFFDEYEHVIVFNDYAISGDLIYDSFLGIHVPRVNVYFEKQVGNTKRPNVGGYVLTGGKLTQNWEYTVANITKYYDTFTVNENANFVNYARNLLGYRQNVDYMKDLGVTAKSQFLFYKGLIQSKGTIGSINAFTNSSQLNAASIDEFWAYKSHEFGENRPKVSYQLNLKPEDTSRSHMKLQFVVGNETVGQFFESIANQDNSRWVEYPNQRSAILANENVSFDLKVDSVDDVTVNNPVGSITAPYFKHTVATAIKVLTTRTDRYEALDVQNESITLPFYYPVGSKALVVFVNGVKADFTELTANRIYVPGALDQNVIVAMKAAQLIEGTHYKRLNTRVVQLMGSADLFGPLQVVRLSSNVERNVPVSLIDRTAKSTVADMTTWDPAAGFYTDEILLNVDTYSKTDPAKYNAVVDLSRRDTNRFWNAPEVGTVWADTGSYQFVQYHDSISGSVADMLLNWGRLEEWSDPSIYTWVESSVSPDQWTDGKPYQEVYTRARGTSTLTVTSGVVSIAGTANIISGDEVFFLGAQPTLFDKRAYVASNVGGVWTILDRDDSSIQSLPEGFTATIMKANFDDTWTTVPRQSAVFETAEVPLNGQLDTPFINAEYAAYLDGRFILDGYTDENGIIDLTEDIAIMPMILTMPFASQLTVNIKTGVVDGLATTEPAAFDLTDATTQEFVGYPTVQVETHNELTGAVTTTYYFWVRGSSIEVGENITTGVLEAYVDTNTKPYVVFNNPIVRNGATVLSQLIAVGISGLVTAENRFVLRLVKDDTLRDKAYVDDQGGILKPIFSEWKMFRQEQESAVDRRLWDKITESIVGYKLADPTIPVPALDRVVYDKLNSTNTRYGLDIGQAFVNGPQAIETIYAELNDPTVDFSPNDVDLFLATHDFATAANTIKFMNDLYGTLASKHVNKVFFSVLMDALSIVGADYSSGIIKTSGIAVRSSMPLNVNGAYDE